MQKSISTMIVSSFALLLSSSIVSAQTASSSAAASSTTTALKAITTLACYKSSSPLTLFGEYGFATSGWCRDQCAGINQPVMALSGGSTCYCGGTIPALDQQVASSNCNSPCNGYGTETCGGMNFWQVYLTGMTMNVPTAANSTGSSSASGTTSASPSIITKAGATVVVTASSAATAAASSGSTSKIGIAVGVVIGVLVVASLIGGFALVLKQRRKKAIEEEHMRNAVLASKRSETTSADSRLDPVIFSHRRESVGSIADEMDYSRRILQVRNPDHRASHQSGVVP